LGIRSSLFLLLDAIRLTGVEVNGKKLSEAAVKYDIMRTSINLGQEFMIDYENQ